MLREGCECAVSCIIIIAQGLFPGDVPSTWLTEQDLFVCLHCVQLVVNSKTASHSRHCTSPSLYPVERNETTNPAIDATTSTGPTLPSFEDVCHLRCPALRFVPKKARRSAFTKALSTTLRSILTENSEEAWLKLLMRPKCVLPTLKRKGRHLKPTNVSTLCDLWSKNSLEPG